MLHLYKYRIKCMIRNRSMLFWTLAFPLILTTLFSLVLTNAYVLDKFETIPIAMVKTDAYQQNTTLQATLKSVSDGKEALFDITYVTDEAQAKKLLDDEKIDAYVMSDKAFTIRVSDTGVNQTVVETFFNEYLQKEAIVKRMVTMGGSVQQIQEIMSDTSSYIEQEGINNDNIMSVFFYTVLAMDAMFGGYWAIRSTYEIQANQSSHAARVSVSPISKAQSLLVDFSLNIAFQVVFLAILFSYMYFLLDIEFGVHIVEIFVALVVGCFAGNGLGVLVGTQCVKGTLDSKINILSSITMLGSFLAGMMMVQMKYIVQVYAPFVNYINPVNMITDALYSLYYYGVGERYYMNLISLFVFALLCYGLSFMSLRKKAYDSLEVR